MINIVFFTAAVLIYLSGTVFYILHWTMRSRKAGFWGSYALGTGAAVHAMALATRWVESGHPPVANLFESLSFFAWLIVIAYLLIEWRYGYRMLGALVSPLALAAILAASILPKRIRLALPALQSRWLAVHVGVSMSAYVVFTLAFVAAMAYLLQERELRLKRASSLYHQLPPLRHTEQLGRILAAVGLGLMTLAIISGSMWAEKAWGSPWSWEPKQMASLMVWLIYAVYFYVRNVANWPRRRAAWLLVAGFVALVVSYLGVGLLMPGRHGFGQ